MINLAIDIDGVLCNNHKYWSSLAEKEGITQPIFTNYNTIFKVRCSDGKIFGEKLFDEYLEDWVLNSEPFPEVQRFFDYLNNESSIRFRIVTSRRIEFRDYTETWLAKNNIEGFEDIHFLKDKTKAPCNAIIDDKPSHVESYRKVSRLGMLMDAEHNKNYNFVNRYQNLEQVIDKLKSYGYK